MFLLAAGRPVPLIVLQQSMVPGTMVKLNRSKKDVAKSLKSTISDVICYLELKFKVYESSSNDEIQEFLQNRAISDKRKLTKNGWSHFTNIAV